ncbi:protein ECERIFERUM 26-like [Actinidia eriantha]|uniref:protein ECERIFERUM 26-like n=1 Tax=Actinidia eriantha TaxID=165200 RepID=UPI00258433F5|nr:protein ECERIFERUM 26-like [Actinidia eriantha]
MADQITYICKRTVVSTKPVPLEKFHNLSVLDRVMQHHRVRMVYYYRAPASREVGDMTKKLRESISEMLCGFPMVTGRLLKDDKGQWMVKCNDAGVRMVEARAKGSVEEWLRRVDREKELKLVHWEDMYYKPYFWSTFYVQITEFEGGGLAIGLSCTHLLTDPTCAAMFIKAWADTTLGGKMLTPPLFHPLPLRRCSNNNPHCHPYTALIDHYESLIEKPILSTTSHHSTMTLAFTSEMVQSCMAMAKTLDPMDGFDPTPFEALAGLFWVCVSKVKGKKHGGLTNMSICLDMRKVLGLDKGFFGNCMVCNRVHGEGLEESGLSKAAFAIREVVEKMDHEGVMDLVEWLEGSDYQITPPFMNGGDLICVNLDCVDSNSAIFEDCFNPIRVSCYIEPVFGEGQILILPSPPGEGMFARVVMVTLPGDEIAKLCEDVLFLQFNPSILMAATKN